MSIPIPRALNALLALTFLIFGTAGPAVGQLEMPRTSPGASVTQTVGVAEVAIEYHRPGVKGRTIWDSLVPYDEVWRAGANERTTFTTSHDVTIEGEPLPAGRYGLLTIPRTGSWTVIFSKVADSWGAYEYSPDNDVLRVEVTPREAPLQEWLQFRFEDLSEDSALAVLHWNRLAVPFRVGVDLDGLVMENIGSTVRWQYPYQAVTYALESGKHLDEAEGWIESSLALDRNFFNLAAKARLRAESESYEDAVRIGQEALAAADAMENPPPEGYRRQLADEIATWRQETAQ